MSTGMDDDLDVITLSQTNSIGLAILSFVTAACGSWVSLILLEQAIYDVKMHHRAPVVSSLSPTPLRSSHLSILLSTFASSISLSLCAIWSSLLVSIGQVSLDFPLASISLRSDLAMSAMLPTAILTFISYAVMLHSFRSKSGRETGGGGGGFGGGGTRGRGREKSVSRRPSTQKRRKSQYATGGAANTGSSSPNSRRPSQSGQPNTGTNSGMNGAGGENAETSSKGYTSGFNATTTQYKKASLSVPVPARESTRMSTSGPSQPTSPFLSTSGLSAIPSPHSHLSTDEKIYSSLSEIIRDLLFLSSVHTIIAGSLLLVTLLVSHIMLALSIVVPSVSISYSLPTLIGAAAIGTILIVFALQCFFYLSKFRAVGAFLMAGGIISVHQIVLQARIYTYDPPSSDSPSSSSNPSSSVGDWAQNTYVIIAVLMTTFTGFALLFLQFNRLKISRANLDSLLLTLRKRIAQLDYSLLYTKQQYSLLEMKMNSLCYVIDTIHLIRPLHRPGAVAIAALMGMQTNEQVQKAWEEAERISGLNNGTGMIMISSRDSEREMLAGMREETSQKQGSSTTASTTTAPFRPIEVRRASGLASGFNQSGEFKSVSPRPTQRVPSSDAIPEEPSRSMHESKPLSGEVVYRSPMGSSDGAPINFTTTVNTTYFTNPLLPSGGRRSLASLFNPAPSSTEMVATERTTTESVFAPAASDAAPFLPPLSDPTTVVDDVIIYTVPATKTTSTPPYAELNLPASDASPSKPAEIPESDSTPPGEFTMTYSPIVGNTARSRIGSDATPMMNLPLLQTNGTNVVGGSLSTDTTTQRLLSSSSHLSISISAVPASPSLASSPVHQFPAPISPALSSTSINAPLALPTPSSSSRRPSLFGSLTAPFTANKEEKQNNNRDSIDIRTEEIESANKTEDIYEKMGVRKQLLFMKRMLVEQAELNSSAFSGTSSNFSTSTSATSSSSATSQSALNATSLLPTVDFPDVLRHPIGLEVFKDFCQASFSSENILFWLSVEQYKSLFTSNGGMNLLLKSMSSTALYEMKEMMVEELIKEFIKKDSAHMINVSHEKRTEILKHIQSIQATSHHISSSLSLSSPAVQSSSSSSSSSSSNGVVENLTGLMLSGIGGHKSKYKKDLFDGLQKEVYSLMFGSTWRDFKCSPQFQSVKLLMGIWDLGTAGLNSNHQNNNISPTSNSNNHNHAQSTNVTPSVVSRGLALSS